MQPFTTLDAEREHQQFLRERKEARESYKIAAALAALGDVKPHAIRIACPLPNAEFLIDFGNDPIGENSIEFAQYARRMRDWNRRTETTRISPLTHPIEWAWSQGRPALGFRPECVPVEFEYLDAQEQLDILTKTGHETAFLYLDGSTRASTRDVTTFVEGETLDTSLSDPVPDYIRAREVGLSLTSMELAFAHDDESDDGNAEPGGTSTTEDGYCKPDPIVHTDRFGWEPPTPYMRSWVDWEKRRKFSGNVIRTYPICKNGMLDFQVDGLPRADGNTTAAMRQRWITRAVETVVAGGLTNIDWQSYADWVDWNRDEARSIGLTKAQKELYFQAPALEAEQQRWTWVDREYQEVYEAPEELTDEQLRNQETPAMLLHLRTHKSRGTAENSMRPDVQNSPNILGLHAEINWLRDEEEDDLTYSERVENWFVGVEKALLEGLARKIEAQEG